MNSPFELLEAPLFLITARDRWRESGMIATWVLSASLLEDRGRVIAALTPGGFTAELIEASRHFVVHLLAEGQHELVPRFGLHSGRDGDKFSGLELDRTRHGIALIRGTCGYAECEVADMRESGERLLIVAGVEREEAYKAREPLTLDTAYRVLPPDIVKACDAQRRRDGARDHRLAHEG